MYHLENGFADPTSNTPLLSLLLQGIKRTSAPSKSVPRKPITTSTLRSLKSSLKSADIPHSHYLLYWAAFSLAFYGFLRVGEYTAPTRFSTNARTLLARHLLLAADSLTISLPSSKTSQFAPPAPIHIGATSSSMCPVQAMRRFLRSRRAPLSAPLFVFPDGSFLSSRLVSTTLKWALLQAGEDPTAYSSHSLRIGAATTAAAAGLPDHLIQKLGRWRSGAYKSYIRPQPDQLQSSSVTISRGF